MVLLQNVSGLYQRKDEELDGDKLGESLKKMREINYFSMRYKKTCRYSPDFCQGVSLLLNLEETKRLGYVSLYKQLEPFIEQIEAFDVFEIKLEVPV